MHKILSIIVPAYNMQDYIGRCLKSLLSDSGTNEYVEIIVVDDGSIDATSEVVKSYMAKHQNLRLIQQCNAGVSSARNSGISASVGDFIAFVDADDYVAEDSLNHIINRLLAVDSESDIIVLDTLVLPGHKYYAPRLNNDRKYDNLRDFYLGYGFIKVVWGCLIRSSMIMKFDISFQEEVKNSEDTLFITECQIRARRFEYWNVMFYNYVEREGSAFTSYARTRFLGYKRCLDIAHKLKQDNQHESDFKRLVLAENLYLCIANSTVSCVCCRDAFFRDIHSLCKAYLPLEEFSQSRLYNRIRMLNKSLMLYYFVFWLMYKIIKPMRKIVYKQG